MFSGITRLFTWSCNCVYSPFALFLDLVGYNLEMHGEDYTANQPNLSHSLGYYELDLLGKALREYSNDPGRAHDYISFLDFCSCNDLDCTDMEDEETLEALSDLCPWYPHNVEHLPAAV